MKKILSLILALVMVIGLAPMAALASETEETEENLWSGRSAVFVGDSITAGVGTTKLYYQFLDEKLDFSSVTAMGVGGSCISAYSDYGTRNQPLINRYQDIPSADLIVIFMGTNDYGHETPLGSVKDTADGTFYGALNVIIPALVEKHTSSKIVFVTSLHRYGAGTSQILGTKFTYDNIPNGVGAALGDYVDALKTVCANNDVSVIDLYTECTLDPSDAIVRSTYMPDGIHPNAAGHEVVAGIMESHIRGYEPAEKEPIKLAELVQGNKFAAGNDQPCRASSRINYYLKAGTVITLKDPAAMQWACARTSDENSSNNLGYFPDAQWTDKVTAVVAEDGWIGFTFKYRDETQAFDLTRPLSDLITIEKPHTHIYEATITAPTCTEQGYTTYTCTACGDSYVADYVDATGHSYANGFCTVCGINDPNPYAGKTIACIGNSITAGVGVTKDQTDYVTLLAKSLGMDYIRLGASGTTLCAGGHATCNVNKLTEANLAGADVVTILMGINDFVQARSNYYRLGTVDSTDTSTVYGAAHMWCQEIEKLRQKDSLKDTEFYFMTPVITSWNNSVSSVRDWDQNKTNVHGYTLRDLCNAIIEVCALYDIPVIDLNLISGLYYNSGEDNTVTEFGGDGAHPGTVGHQMMADAIEHALLKDHLRDDHDHSYGSWITTTYPDCEAGEQQRVCSVCTATEKRSLAGSGHDYKNGICTGCGAEAPDPEDFAGKSVSILSHSMSTYAGVSNNTSYNSTIGNNDVYYTAGKHGVYQKDTWWQQAIDALGMELLVNNSWSGSCVFMPRRGEASVGYGDRAVNLHNDRTGEEPEIIWVYLGCNDFAYYKDTFGKAEDVDYDALIRDNGDETFTYATPTTTCEAYAIMLHKVAHRYPDAEIYCMTSTARRETDYTGDSYPDAGQPTEYSVQLQQIAAYWGYPVVGLEKAIPKDVEIFDKYMGDKRAHANQLGMDQITNAVLAVMLGENAEIRHVTSENGVVAEQAVLLGGSYRAEVEIQDGYSVVVTMGGKDVTDEVYKDGRITIAEVTGDIAVSAVITRDPLNFRWEFKDDVLTSVGETENTLLELSATVENGILNDGRYELTIPVVLKHDHPWSVEWRCAENWRGVLLSSDPAPAAGMTYLSRVNGGQLCFGVWTGTQYNNYGVDISDLDNQEHTYRLENRIAADGSNMVWLYVDGIESGSMIHYFIGSKDQSSTSDWASGKDFIFSYIGIESHALRNCRLDYLEVTECEHVYENGVCTVCGAVHPNLASFEGKVISILGDSISTFAGYIPVADGFNLEHLARYPQDNLLTDVNETWWMQVITALGGKLGINDSWRGATVSGAVPVTTGTTGENAAMSNLTRIQNLGANGTPDVILFYGGTNDLAHVSKVGSFDPNTAPTTVDLTTKKWDNLAEAYVHTLLRLRHFYPDAQIVCLLPTYTTSYYSNTKLAQANEVLARICEHYGVAYTDLCECGITTADLPDGIHPNAAGMDFITEATMETVLDECEMEVGENVVHSVTHTLTGAKSSLSYYKGVTHGKTFVTAITGEEVTVSVTMGGVDITDAVYADGVVTIAAVTGDVVITAQGRVKTIYEDHLQQLPDEVCAGLNLWNVLEHDAEYYTVSGWGVHDSGKVYSVTFPVSAGDRIYASSFGAAGSNGQSSVNGIRTTFFDADGLLITMGADKVYAEFAANGFITAPDGAVAVNIPMWSVSDDNEIYVLNQPHIYDDWHESSDGEERRDCLICDHYETRKIIAAAVGENQYTSLDAAIEAASAVNGTVTLLTDLTVKGVVIPSGVTLDLADYSLTAGYIVGLNGGYLTATPNAGRLIVSKSSLFLAGQGFKNASGQYILPVWDSEQSCYVFSLFVVNTNNAERGLFIDEENETIRFQFKHQATGAINQNLLNDGSSDNALKVIVRLVWESENGEAYQDFVYNDGFVKKVAVGENGVSYDYSFTLTGYSALNINLNTLKIVGMIIADSGAVASGTVWTAEMAK